MSDIETAAAAFLETQRRFNDEFAKLGDLLDQIAGLLREYIALPYQHIDILIALWIAGTYCFEKFQTFGYLALRSATPRCGKTRLLRLIAALSVGAPPITANPTAATLFRATRRVLILDEVDQLRNRDKDNFGDVMAALNSGFEASGTVERLERTKGGTFEVRSFSTYAPKALAGIEALADTIADRSFAVQMVRAEKRMPRLSARFLQPVAEELRTRLAAWFGSYEDKIADIYAELPAELSVLAEFTDDRFQDCAESLVVIASIADEERPAGPLVLPRLLDGLRAASGQRQPSGRESQLLAMLEIFEEYLGGAEHKFIKSTDLLNLCSDREEVSSIDSPRRLAGFLKHFDLFVSHNTAKTERGYTVTADWIRGWRSRYGSRRNGEE